MANQSPHIGSPDFFKSIIASIRDATNDKFPLDMVILQSLLLCVIARDKHVILRTSPEDLTLVCRLVSLSLSALFGFPSHKVRIRQKSASADTSSSASAPFLRSLFIQEDVSRPRIPRKRSRVRSRSRSLVVNNGFSRTASFPNDLSATPNSPLRSSTLYSPGDLSEAETEASSHHRRGAFPMQSPASNGSYSRSPILPHLPYSDPTPIRPLDPQVSSRLTFPTALVMSGLEHASFASQKSLTQVLSDRCVVLDDTEPDDWNEEARKRWELPSQFILVYVCPADSHERPAIHKNLLDKFAISANVALTESIRTLASGYLGPHGLSSSVSAARPDSSHAHSAASTLGPFHHSTPSQTSTFPSTSTTGQIIPAALLHSLRESYKTTFIPLHLSLYTSDLFAAARHHPQMDGTLLTAKARRDADEIARAGRVLGGSPSGMDLIRIYAAAHRPSTPDSDLKSQQTSTSELWLPPAAHSNIAAPVRDVQSKSPRSPSVEEVGQGSTRTEPSTPLEVSESDIARLVPRVISHRVRIRGGPQDEILGSVVFGSSLSITRTLESHGLPPDSRSVKDVMVSILAEV